jgi:lipopolysaccharide transport system ATP-binding protein
MSDDLVIDAHALSKHYRLGVINHGTLYRDLQSWWARVRSRPDPNSPAGGWSHRQERIQGDIFCAIEDISFNVKRGEILGIIGGNGAGKSTLLKILSRITAPSSGTVGLSGRVASLLEVGTGFHPELTGRENIYLNGAILGMSRREVAQKFDDIVAFAEVSDFIDTPVKRYSSGMYVRLAFSVAAHLESEILLIDEVLAVGDVSFQRKCLGKMKDIGSGGRTVLFVSHNMAAIERLCTRVIVLKDGRVDFNGATSAGIEHYFSLFDRSKGPLFDTSIRNGDGRARVENVWFESTERCNVISILQGGSAVEICVSIKAKTPDLRNVTLAIGLTTIHGEGVLHLSTDVSGFDLPTVPDVLTLRCSIPRLTLRKQLYSMNIYLTAGGVVMDWLQDCLRFQVEDGDFYGTGRMPPEGYSSVLIDYRWSMDG